MLSVDPETEQNLLMGLDLHWLHDGVDQAFGEQGTGPVLG